MGLVGEEFREDTAGISASRCREPLLGRIINSWRLESAGGFFTCLVSGLGGLKGSVHGGLLTQAPTHGFFMCLGLLPAWPLVSKRELPKRAARE